MSGEGEDDKLRPDLKEEVVRVFLDGARLF
jgi:hypothetical protein